MPCMRIGNAIVTYSDNYRLRLADGTCVYMDWHDYCGPTFFKDRDGERMIEDWWENQLIVDALDWFTGRGHKA